MSSRYNTSVTPVGGNTVTTTFIAHCLLFVIHSSVVAVYTAVYILLCTWMDAMDNVFVPVGVKRHYAAYTKRHVTRRIRWGWERKPVYRVRTELTAVVQTLASSHGSFEAQNKLRWRDFARFSWTSRPSGPVNLGRVRWTPPSSSNLPRYSSEWQFARQRERWLESPVSVQYDMIDCCCRAVISVPCCCIAEIKHSRVL